MDQNEPVTWGQLRDVCAAILFASMRSLSEEQRVRLRDDLATAALAAGAGAHPKSAQLLSALADAAEVARRHVGKPPGS